MKVSTDQLLTNGVCNLFQNSFPYHYFQKKRPHVGWSTVQFSLLFILSWFHHPLIRTNTPQELSCFLDVFILCQFIISDLFDILKCAFYFIVKLVGGVTFLPDTIGTMVTFIITEVRRNESLYTTKTSNGSQTVLEYISSFLCPNNCSDNGNCTSGKYLVVYCSDLKKYIYNVMKGYSQKWRLPTNTNTETFKTKC